MMKRIVASVFAAATLISGIAIGQPTDEQYAEHIRRGQAAKGQEMGLRLRDTGRGIGNGIMAGLGGMALAATTSSGFSLLVYTPLSWAAQQASGRAKNYMTFDVSQLTEEDRAPVVRVLVFPDTPNYVTGGAARSSVEHVVVRDTRGGHVIQPLSIEPFDQTVSNAMGGSIALNGVTAIFSLEQLQAVRKADKKTEFTITVIGNGRTERTFKVKSKHIKQLPL